MSLPLRLYKNTNCIGKGQVKAPPEFNQALSELMAKIRKGEPLTRRTTERSVSHPLSLLFSAQICLKEV